MNERIEQLAEQCWVHTNKPLFGAKSPHWEFDRQKFAELIVRECIQVVDDMADPEEDSDRYVWAIHNASEKIKKHFGVEE
jgi:hypothetical protein